MCELNILKLKNQLVSALWTLCNVMVQMLCRSFPEGKGSNAHRRVVLIAIRKQKADVILEKDKHKPKVFFLQPGNPKAVLIYKLLVNDLLKPLFTTYTFIIMAALLESGTKFLRTISKKTV